MAEQIKKADNTTSIDVVDMDIQNCIIEFCEDEGIDDLRKVPQTVWTYLMTYIGMKLFKKKHGFFKDLTLKESGCAKTIRRDMDLDKIDAAADYYIALCRKYDKVATLAGLCEFIGVSRSYFSNNKDTGTATRRRQIREKIYYASEDTAGEVLISGKRSPMSILPYLNHYHGWQRDISTPVDDGENSVSSLPDLSGYLPKNEE